MCINKYTCIEKIQSSRPDSLTTVDLQKRRTKGIRIRVEGEREKSKKRKKAEVGEMESGEFAELILKGLIDPIYFFDGAETNFKITTLDDIEIFKALLAAKKASWQK